MISSVKYDSVNINSSVDVNIKEPSENPGVFSSQLVNICNIPVELKQKIACNLDSKDYASLREAGKAMSESLDSFSVMNNKLKEGVSGDTGKNILKVMRDKLIINLFGSSQNKEIMLALKNCSTCAHPILENTTKVQTEYLPDNYGDNYQDRIRQAVELCRRGITSFIPSGSSQSFMPHLAPDELWNVTINFNDEDINKKSLVDIFSSFNEVYKNTEGPERFVVANMASTLRNYWGETPPSELSKNDINHLSVAYPELLGMGDNIVKLLGLLNTVI